MTDKSIYFYSPRGRFSAFSNFSPHSFNAEGRLWKTSEHYFQAHKFESSSEYFNRVWAV